jgi:hypothetical protein
MNITDGYCGIDCPAGSVDSNGATVDHPAISHGTEIEIQCEYPFGDSIVIKCYDSQLLVTGQCGQNCIGGTIMENGGKVTFESLAHNEVKNYTCENQYASSTDGVSFTSVITFACHNGDLEKTGICWADCPDGSIKDNGITVLIDAMLYLESRHYDCEPNYKFGTVEVTCDQGTYQVLSGSCGVPCAEAPYASTYTRSKDVLIPEIIHGGTLDYVCPIAEGLSGSFTMSCVNGQRNVISGTCGERCPAQGVNAYGASFVSPLMDHDSAFEQPCVAPFNGSVELNCTFGQLVWTSHCGTGCFAGNYTLPNGAVVFYSTMTGGTFTSLSCPPGYYGDSVTLQCMDGQPELAGGYCHAGCSGGAFETDTWRLTHGDFYHNSSNVMTCPDGFMGTVTLQCFSGVLTMSTGYCFQECASATFNLKPGVAFVHGTLEHMEVSSNYACPPGYVGSVRLQCLDGEVEVAEGACPAHCPSGAVQGAAFNDMQHLEETSITCPEAGLLNVRCEDRIVTVTGGQCLYGCPAGQIEVNGTSVGYLEAAHNTSQSGTCTGNSVGSVRVKCFDTNVSLDPLPGERCFDGCSQRMTSTRDGTWFTTPLIGHDQRANVQCPGGKLGVIELHCFDDEVTILSGTCGPENCAAGTVPQLLADDTTVQLVHPAFNDGHAAGPGLCPSPYQGEASFTCRNGTVEIDDVTLVVSATIDFLPPPSLSNSTAEVDPDERFLLCACCADPPMLPGVQSLAGFDEKIILVWALSAGSAGLVLAAASGLWLMRPKPKPNIKASRVLPDPNAVLALGDIQKPGTMALGDIEKPGMMMLQMSPVAALPPANNANTMVLEDDPAAANRNTMREVAMVKFQDWS